MSNSGIPIVKDIARAGGKAIEGTLNVVNSIIQNPLPVVTMVAATWALGPSGLAITSSTATAAALASGAIAASQGKNVGQIAQSALLAYGGAEFAKFSNTYTGSGDFTASIGNSIGGTTGSAVTSGLNNAMFNSTVALLGGKDVGQAFGAGFLGGAAGSAAGSAMNSEVGKSFFGTVKDAFGLDDSQMKYIQGASQTMGTAAISGQDPQLALTNYVAQSIANVGKTAVGKQFTSAKEAFITSKLNLDQEAENQQQIINTRNALYEEAKPVADQYTALKSQYDDVVNKLKADNDYIQNNRGGYDAAMAAYESDKNNENVDRVNAEIDKLKPYTDSFDKNKSIYDQLGVQLKDLNTKLTDYSLRLNGFDSKIQASNDKITQLSDTFADTAAEFEKTSKQVGTSLVETATSDIELAEITRQEEAAKEAERLEAERQNTLRIEEERQAEEARAAAQAEADRQAILARIQRDGEERAKAEELHRLAREEAGRQAEIARQAEAARQAEEEIRKVEAQKPPAKPDITEVLENTGLQPPGAVYDIDDTDIGSEIGSETVTTSPGEEPLADLSKSGVMMPDGSYKTWAELDELAGVPPGTIYTDGGTTITEQELQDILNGTYTPRGTTPKPTTPTTPKPTTPTPTTPKPTTPAPTTPVAQQQLNPLGMLALLDVLGQQPQQQPAMQDPYAKIKSFQGDLFGEDISTDFLGAATGGSVDDLLRLLRS